MKADMTIYPESSCFSRGSLRLLAEYCCGSRWIGTVMVATLPQASDAIEVLREGSIGPVTACLMPTHGSVFNRLSENEIELSSGALLVKANGAVKISATICGQKAFVTVARGVTAMVSCLDSKIVVLNLISDSNTYVKLLVPHATRKTYELAVPLGTQATFTGEKFSALSSLTLAPGRQKIEHELADGGHVHSFPFDYTTTLKVYGIARCLPKVDYKTLLKVAAAVSVVCAR
jgi:hypothetical protein